MLQKMGFKAENVSIGTSPESAVVIGLFEVAAQLAELNAKIDHVRFAELASR